MMTGSRRAVAFVVLVVLVLVPLLGIAADDLSGSGRAAARETGLRHQPPRPWRTIPAALESPVAMPRMVLLGTLEASELASVPQVVIRPPFVPPRG
jgi:hypothetical protein